MKKSDVSTEAFTVSQKIVGLALGIPFFLGLLALHSNNRVLLVWAIGYVACVVFPAAAGVSSAMAVFVAPIGQERAYAKAAATWSASVLFALVILFSTMQIYAFWPFASAMQLLQALVGLSTKPIIPIMLGGIILVPGFAALGYSAGHYGRRHPTHFLARFFKLCWKRSRKDPLTDSAA